MFNFLSCVLDKAAERSVRAATPRFGSPCLEHQLPACVLKARVGEKVSEVDSFMIYTIISLLVTLWFIGFLLHFGGGFIHALLLLAGIIFVYDLLVGRRTAV